MLTSERVRELLDYDPETGALRWRVRRGRISAGSPAGTVDRRPTHNYVVVKIDGRSVGAHRLAWLHYYGAEAPDEIDHVNVDGTDNRIVNLRLADRSDNCCNRRTHATNALGIKGVRLHHRGVFEARIMRNGIPQSLGMFSSAAAAKNAYDRAAAVLHGKFARDR